MRSALIALAVVLAGAPIARAQDEDRVRLSEIVPALAGTELGALDLGPAPAPGAVRVVRVTDGDNQTFGEFSALVITNPAQNLYGATMGPTLLEARRAPVVLGGNATTAARYLHVIAGDDGGAALSVLLYLVASSRKLRVQHAASHDGDLRVLRQAPDELLDVRGRLVRALEREQGADGAEVGVDDERARVGLERELRHRLGARLDRRLEADERLAVEAACSSTARRCRRASPPCCRARSSIARGACRTRRSRRRGRSRA